MNEFMEWWQANKYEIFVVEVAVIVVLVVLIKTMRWLLDWLTK